MRLFVSAVLFAVGLVVLLNGITGYQEALSAANRLEEYAQVAFRIGQSGRAIVEYGPQAEAMRGIQQAYLGSIVVIAIGALMSLGGALLGVLSELSEVRARGPRLARPAGRKGRPRDRSWRMAMGFSLSLMVLGGAGLVSRGSLFGIDERLVLVVSATFILFGLVFLAVLISGRWRARRRFGAFY